MYDEEAHDPSPERKDLERQAEEVRLLDLKESSTNSTGGMTESGVHFRMTSGDAVRMGWRGVSRSRQRVIGPQADWARGDEVPSKGHCSGDEKTLREPGTPWGRGGCNLGPRPLPII